MGSQRGTRNTDTPAASHPHRRHQRQPTPRRRHLRHTPHTRAINTTASLPHTPSQEQPRNRQTHTSVAKTLHATRHLSRARRRGPEFRRTAPLGSPSRVCGSVCVVAAPASCIRVHTHASLCTSDAAVTSPDTLHSYCFTATSTQHTAVPTRGIHAATAPARQRTTRRHNQ
jgi:hypothetical protein